MDEDRRRIAAAYDALADDYDSQVASSQWIRGRLWQRMDRLFPPGSNVLDVTAGTGLDALHLAERGVHVIAGDISPQMLARLSAKAQHIETRVLDFNRLSAKHFDLKFDGIISTFAGLNTSNDLHPFATGAVDLLPRGGLLFIHLLNRWPLREILHSLFHRRWLEAWRQMKGLWRVVNLGGVDVPHYLYSPLWLYQRTFSKYFQLRRVEAQGLLLALDTSGKAVAKAWEQKINRRYPFYLFGTFFSLEMIRK